MDTYVNDFSKMALALTSAQMAKDNAVKEYGVGEEVALHFLGWAPERLSVVCQMQAHVTRLAPNEKFERCSMMTSMIRRFWGATSITMVSEGYCSKDTSKTKNMDLAAAFADKNLPVFECISVSHVSINEDGGITPVSMVAAPFTVNLGKTVEWHDVLVYPDKAEHHISQRKYPTMLRKSLDEPVADLDNLSLDQIGDMRQDIDNLGFLVQDIQ